MPTKSRSKKQARGVLNKRGIFHSLGIAGGKKARPKSKKGGTIGRLLFGKARTLRTEKNAIRKLRALGLIQVADLRKATSPAQRRALKKYGDVLSGRATVVRPKKPGTFKRLFRVVRGNVIVPRRKGERVRVSKSGEITSTRKVGKRTVRATYKHVPTPGEKSVKRKPRVVYALPVQRGGGVEWYRWKSYDAMVQDMQTGSLKGYKNYADYVVEEHLGVGEPSIPTGEDEEERNDRLDGIMVARLQGRRANRAAFIGEQEGY